MGNLKFTIVCALTAGVTVGALAAVFGFPALVPAVLAAAVSLLLGSVTVGMG